MIVAIWFSIVGFVMLVGLGLVVLTFRHWIVEHNKQKKLAQHGESNIEIQSTLSK